MNNYTSSELSLSWYNKNKKMLSSLKANIRNYFRRYTKAKASSGDIMWTCFGKYEDELKGEGYTQKRKITKGEKGLSSGKLDKLEKELSCFVPCNARATNIYRERWALAYCVNMYFNPMIRRFFTDNNTSIYPNDDLYALSCLIQWIFRSRIRDGKSIDIYIPSGRMRKLLFDWLDCKI